MTILYYKVYLNLSTHAMTQKYNKKCLNSSLFIMLSKFGVNLDPKLQLLIQATNL